MAFKEATANYDRTTTPVKTSSDIEFQRQIVEDHKIDIDAGFDPANVKRIVRKVDLRLIPVLSALYCISLIDRTNLSLAREANQRQMDKDLVLTGSRYSLATLMFFVPYVSAFSQVDEETIISLDIE